MKDIRQLKAQKYIGTAQLADEAARLISRFVPRQERGSVAELPDERMVRYYSAEGLISAPEGKQGAAAVYGYEHLLQLVVIKRLQAEHLPIRKIKELVEGKSESELEQLLDIDQARPSRPSPKNSATEYLQSLLRPAPSPAPSMRAPAPAPLVSSSIQSKSAWARVEIEPGLELHIRDDYRLPDDGKDRQRLARRLLNEIESHGLQPRK